MPAKHRKVRDFRGLLDEAGGFIHRAPLSSLHDHDYLSAHSAVCFNTLLITKEDGGIVRNPHLANCCVLQLDEQAATVLHGVIGDWLG